MSIKRIETCMTRLADVTNWKVYGLRYRHRESFSEYEAYDLHFDDVEDLKSLIADIVAYCTERTLPEKESVENYNGYNPPSVINRLPITDTLVCENMQLIEQCIDNSNDTDNIMTANCNAYLIRGSYIENQQNTLVTFIVKKSPIYNYKNKFLFKAHQNTLTVMNDPLFNFTRLFDVLIINDVLYMPTFNAESLFNMERSYKMKCADKLNDISAANIVTDFNLFSWVASSGHFPRRFVTFSDEKLKALSDLTKRQMVAVKLDIKLNDQGQFVIMDESSASKLLKTLCDKTRTDFFDDTLCEVSTSKPLD